MKSLIFKSIIVSGLTLLAASSLKAQIDTSKTKIDYGKGVSIDTNKKKTRVTTISIGGGNLVQRRADTTSTSNKGRFVGGITFTRVDLGFSRLIDNGSFELSATNDFLDYRGGKTSTFSFDVLQFGYRFNSNFKLYVAGGFDWTHIRLKNNVTIQKNTPALVAIPENIEFSKNRFSSSYVHVPLNFEFRTKENSHGERFYLVFGPEVSFLLNGKVKQISNENGKQKFTDDYTFAQFRYGGTVRLGYGALGLFAKYYPNDMFEGAAQRGLTNMSVGITFGLN